LKKSMVNLLTTRSAIAYIIKYRGLTNPTGMPPRSQSPERSIGAPVTPARGAKPSSKGFGKPRYGDSVMSDYSEMTLAKLFATADEVGDKYLSDDEISKRKRRLDSLKKELNDKCRQTLEKYPLL